ncbi:NRDE family protein [Pontibacterium sp.]|uniref:NRDE family protein n=1 Tax=Pontibacterium sp. TaxID=2036026 RepID=UPI0035174835
MCLITFAYNSHPEYSLILLANRDEFFQRPSQAIHHWPDAPQILAGRDLEQGGTWLGLNQSGRFATVTNHRNGRDKRDSLRSRGDLTRHFLRGSQSAAEYLTGLEPEQQAYGAFNLLLGDETGLHYLSNRHADSATAISPGVYGLSNALLDTSWPKVTKVREGLRQLLAEREPNRDAMLALMQDRAQARDEHLPDTGISLEWERMLSSCFIQSEHYGTRAITLLMQKPDGNTYLREQTFDVEGNTDVQEFDLQLPAIGAADREEN